MPVKSYETNSPTVAKGTTSFDDGHSHTFTLPINGIGKTDPGPKDGHIHYVVKFTVGFTDDHNHYIRSSF